MPANPISVMLWCNEYHELVSTRAEPLARARAMTAVRVAAETVNLTAGLLLHKSDIEAIARLAQAAREWDIDDSPFRGAIAALASNRLSPSANPGTGILAMANHGVVATVNQLWAEAFIRAQDAIGGGQDRTPPREQVQPPRPVDGPDGPRPPDEFLWQGHSAHLEAKPYAVLTALWASPDRRVPIDDLLRTIWEDSDGEGSFNAAVTRINRAMDPICPLRVRRKSGVCVLE